jgi:hypothetical protein
MHNAGVDIQYVTIFGAIFSLPYLFSPILHSFFSRHNLLTQRSVWLLFAQWYLCLYLLTLTAPGKVAFSCLALLAAGIGALFEILIVHNIKQLSKDTHSAASKLYIGQLAGMTLTSQAVLLLRTWFSWAAIYQIMICASFILALPSINRILVGTKVESLGISAAILDLTKDPGLLIWLLILTVLCKIQSGFLSQTTSLFFMSQGMVPGAIFLSKSIGLSGQLLGIFASQVCNTKLRITALFLLRATVGIVFGALAYTELLAKLPDGASAVCLAGALLSVEKSTRVVDNIALISIQLKACSGPYGTSQYAMLSILTHLLRAITEAFSGTVIKHYGWLSVFLLAAATSLITAAVYSRYYSSRIDHA